MIFRLSNIIASKVYEKIEHSYTNSKIILGIVLSLIVTNQIIINKYLYIFSIPIILIFILIYLMNLDFCLKKTLSDDIMGTIISLNGTLIRIFSILVLLGISTILNFFNASTMFFIMTIIFVLISFSFNIYFSNQTNKQNPLK